MTEGIRFEVYDTDAGWRWRLRIDSLVLNPSKETFSSPDQARAAVNRVRAAASVVEDLPEQQFNGTHAGDHVTDVQCATVDVAGQYEWVLTADGDVLARSTSAYETESGALTAATEFCTYASVTETVFIFRNQDQPSSFDVGSTSILAALRSLATLPIRGFKHRRALQKIDTRIVVSGIRGKSSTTRRLDDVLRRRGNDTLTKITGNQPHLIHNGGVVPLNREGPRTTLYENIDVFREYVPKLAKYAPDDVAIFENQGITEYTTRLINESFLDPHVIVLTNIRRDHQDTLGETRADIARSFAKAIPPSTHVVCGEQHPIIYEYLEREVTAVGSTIEQVAIPEEHQGLLGAETVHAVNHTLTAVGEPPVPDDEIRTYLKQIQPKWTTVPNGLVFNAAEVNDVESTEAVRQALENSDCITPFVFLRPDRRGRTASFVSYFDHLADRGIIDVGYVMGSDSAVFVNETTCGVTEIDSDADPGAVLDRLLDRDRPVILMGNTVDEFMRELDAEIESRAQRRFLVDRPRGSPAA
ncbi:hypothetical protein [Haloplanus rubicundus]|uniref:Mur ligase family CapB protein n=1 Tax=Haloplanus rubicundus TaxID=1547898 RepID=A0A345EC37_9EURY|nr:hypothetical protein [Haloplanus rubicundus]AXG09759.1 hypothetical protein DU484_07755 [Haloplanus rubicundus]